MNKKISFTLLTVGAIAVGAIGAIAFGQELKLSDDAGIVDSSRSELSRTIGRRQSFPEATADQNYMIEFRKVYRFNFLEMEKDANGDIVTDANGKGIPKRDANGDLIHHYTWAAEIIANQDAGFGDGFTSNFNGELYSNTISRMWVPSYAILSHEKLLGDQIGKKDLWIIRTKPEYGIPSFIIPAKADDLADIISKYTNQQLVKATWDAPAPEAYPVNVPPSGTIDPDTSTTTPPDNG